VLAFVLGSLLESSLRRSLLVFEGDATGFFSRPISGTLLVIFVIVAVWPMIKKVIDKRKKATALLPETKVKEKV
jgi:putative tricarboxylic transport membrane protein